MCEPRGGASRRTTGTRAVIGSWGKIGIGRAFSQRLPFGQVIAQSVTRRPRQIQGRRSEQFKGRRDVTTPTRAFRFICGGLAACAVIALIPVPASAQASGRHALQRATGSVIPGGPLTRRTQTVVLKMAGDPVAVVRSRAPGKQLPEAQRQSIERDLRSRQDRSEERRVGKECRSRWSPYH